MARLIPHASYNIRGIAFTLNESEEDGKFSVTYDTLPKGHSKPKLRPEDIVEGNSMLEELLERLHGEPPRRLRFAHSHEVPPKPIKEDPIPAVMAEEKEDARRNRIEIEAGYATHKDEVIQRFKAFMEENYLAPRSLNVGTPPGDLHALMEFDASNRDHVTINVSMPDVSKPVQVTHNEGGDFVLNAEWFKEHKDKPGMDADARVTPTHIAKHSPEKRANAVKVLEDLAAGLRGARKKVTVSPPPKEGPPVMVSFNVPYEKADHAAELVEEKLNAMKTPNLPGTGGGGIAA